MYEVKSEVSKIEMNLNESILPEVIYVDSDKKHFIKISDYTVFNLRVEERRRLPSQLRQ